MNAQHTALATALPVRPGRTLAHVLLAALAGLALAAATPAAASQGQPQELLADGGDYAVTNTDVAEGGDYVPTNQTADAGDYGVTNQTADGGDYLGNTVAHG